MLASRQAVGRVVPAQSRPSVCHSRLPAPLRAAAATEVDAIAAYKASSSEGLQPCLTLLEQAARDKSVKPELVEGALAYLEANHAQPATDVEGTWRLVFSTATSSRMMQYIPVQEDFVIQLDRKYCALESEIGPFRFVISGAINAWQPASGEMDFQFNAVDILLFGNKIWKVSPKTKPKTYTFYYRGGSIAAARSSAGGLALLRL